MSKNSSSEANLPIKTKRKDTRRVTCTADNVLFPCVRPKMTEKVIKNTDNNDIIDSENLAGQLCYNLAESDKTILNDILKGINPLRESDFPLLLRMFEQKQLSVGQFEKLLFLKVKKSTVYRSKTCKECTNNHFFLEKEPSWKKKYESSNRALKEIEALLKLQNNGYNKPYVKQRTIGIQALVTSLEEFTSPVVLRKPFPPGIPMNSTIIDLSNDDKANVHGYYNCITSTSPDFGSKDIINMLSVLNIAKPPNTIVNDQESSSTQLHPAPLPEIPRQTSSLSEGVNLPPAPNLNIQKSTGGTMILKWDIPATELPVCSILRFQIFSYHEVRGTQYTNPPKTDMWKSMGCLRALPLPMNCSLRELHPGDKYHFAVRAINAYNQIGPFSNIMSHIA